MDILSVINSLEVGPVRLERSRLRMPYRVYRNGTTDVMELVYRFEEEVFTPEDPLSLNLASVIGAQVALNYGLFCKEIIFKGFFDEDDRAFIRANAENTAREVFVKKFLEPNPFLKSEATGISPVKPETYVQAELIFDEPHMSRVDRRSWKDAGSSAGEEIPSKYAILSSGGKDSLLTFGLIREMGFQVHPIFINESGRHWFTALNAYRFFSGNIPNTGRVWTNADRIFNWMLRHLPFIRRDYARIRSDEYPIRLWTVAVFLFGALPLMRKRGIGYLLIGNEYDTTCKSYRYGIMHYNGLYDQSRYFDNALTRYYHRKGWDVSQFSILRPLSELLIEKTLVERYPELQRYQVSCHAAHKEGGEIRPCGQCEKCRRIVGMLAAVGADPGNCGYSAHQVRQCLQALEKKGMNQEKKGVEQLGFLLREKDLLQGTSIGGTRARQRPEIMRLRFDAERSRFEDIPVDIRERLYRLCLKHASGAVKRSGRTWLPFDPFQDPAFRSPYLHRSLKTASYPGRVAGHMTSSKIAGSYLLGELTWPEAERRFGGMDLALLPVGSIEQHGPHLPLDCDAFDADYLAKRVAESCQDPKPLVFPLIPYGVSYHHEDFSGTLGVSPETLSKLVYDIGMSAARHGITKLVIVNGHGGNGPALHFAAQMINRDAHIFTCVDTGETSDPDIYDMTETPNDVHAGEIETSTTLASRPHLVRLREMRKFVPRFSNRYLDFTSKRSVGWYAHIAKISPEGVLGDPTKADKEKGKRIWDVMIKQLVAFVEDLKRLSLDEIYQRRY